MTSPTSSGDEHTRLILKRFIGLQNTRLLLLKELDNALESCLSKPSNEPDIASKEDQDARDPSIVEASVSNESDTPVTTLPSSSCRHEYKDVNSHPDEYIEQIISISTSGFLEIRDEVKLLMNLLESDLKRPDLHDLLKKIEGLESDKMAECLQRNLVRRKARIEDRDFTQVISIHQKKVDILTESISSLTAEVQAELVELG